MTIILYDDFSSVPCLLAQTSFILNFGQTMKYHRRVDSIAEQAKAHYRVTLSQIYPGADPLKFSA